jgi:hypothetical protein
MKALHLLVLFFILITFFLLDTSVLAQSDPWSEPLNLSHSGAATDPVMVVDASGVMHVFWTDEFDGPMYTRGEGSEWSTPFPVYVPFEGYTPLLIADSFGYIYAFWISDDGVLLYSSANIDIIQTTGWKSVEPIADSVLGLDVALDSQDRFHIAFVRSADTSEGPAGVYYRAYSPRGDGWGKFELLYQSPYFRTLTPEEAHVDIETTQSSDGQQVYVTWDNRPRGQVFFAKSSDDGRTWSDSQEIAKPEKGKSVALPSNLTVYAQDDKVLFLWQTGDSGSSCTQNYQWSLDGGDSWQPRQHLSESFFFDCSQDLQVMHGESGPIVLVESIQFYLLAWDGTRWSDPQIQSTLSSFVDPETQRTVDLGCLQPSIVGLDLAVVACDTNEEDDVYWLRRSLSDMADWYPQESVWQPLTSVTRSENRILSQTVASDAEGRIHVFWTQTDDPALDTPDSAIYYTRWEGERLWSQPVAILDSPEDPAYQPAASLDHSGRILLVWRRGESGEIYFSSADVSEAVLPSTWSSPVRISVPGQLVSFPQPVVSESGEILVVYSVPINEGRGIYLTHSTDGGQSWSQPQLVFDAAAARWEMLDQPRLTIAGDSDLYLLWTRYTLRSGIPRPVALAYARSQDSGATWSPVETVVEGSVAWSAIIRAGEQTVHRFWQELAGARETLWHERSLDGGQTWSRIAPVSVFGQTLGAPSLAQDIAGNLHLLQIVNQEGGDDLLQHWLWDGERWMGSNGLDLDLQEGFSVNALASAVSPQGNLAVIISGQMDNPDLGTQGDEILFTTRSVGLQDSLPRPTSVPSVPVTPVVTEQRTLEPTLPPLPPTPTSTPNLAALGSSGGSPGNSWRGLMIGALLAGVIVSIAFGVGVWKVKS